MKSDAERLSPTGPGQLLWLQLKFRWKHLAAIAIFSVIGALSTLSAAVFQRAFVDRWIFDQQASRGVSPVDHWFHTWSSEGLLVASVIAFLLGLVASASVSMIAVSVATQIQRLLAQKLVEKALSLKTDELAGRTVGETVALLATEVPGSTGIIEQTIPLAATVGFPFIVAPIAIHLVLGIPMLPLLSLMIFVLAVSLGLSTRQSRFFQSFKELAAQRTGIVNEWIQNIRLLRILGWVNHFEQRIRAKREEETENRIAMVSNGQSMGAFGSSANFALNLVGVWTLTRATGRVSSPGDFFLLLWIFGVFLSRPLRQIPWTLTITLDALTSLRRVERFLLLPSSHRWTSIPKKVTSDGSGLSLMIRGLNLSISGHRILRDIDLQVAAGEFIAIVGEVGAGKSLLLQSLLGEVSATFREFQIDGHDVANESEPERRAHFSIVTQEGFIMSGSIRENVHFEYRPEDRRDGQVSQVLSNAGFELSHEGIRSGLDSEIGERGINLSGGQRQRLSLARAAFDSRSILLLDDCLSAVDVSTEEKILSHLIRGQWRNHTRLLVTHRLSALKNADRIYFLKAGRINASGTLAELVRDSAEFSEFLVKMDTRLGEKELHESLS